MRIKNIKTKLKLMGLVAISALFPLLTTNLKAATHTLAKDHPEIESVGLGETMDSTYAFSLKWSSSSKIEYWGNVDKHIMLNSGPSTYDVIMPTNDNLSGKIGCWIYNIGMYKGKPVDLKCTYYWTPLTLNDVKIHPVIAVTYRDDLVGFSFWNHSYEVKHELYSDGKPLSVDMSLTFGDVDGCQYFAFQSNNIEKIQCIEDCIIYYDHSGSRRWIYSDEITKSNTPDCSLRFQLKNAHEFTILFGLPYDSYSYDFKSLSTKDDDYCKKYMIKRTELFTTAFANTANGEQAEFIENHWGYVNGLAYGPYSIDAPIKEVTDTNETNVTTNTLGENESFKYNIYQFVPLELSDYYYDSFILKDTLPACLEYVSSKIYNDANSDVTNLFTISTSGQTITATAKNTAKANFYNTTYRWQINVKLKSNSLGNFKKAANHYQFTNKANLTINRNGTTNKTSNKVTSNYYTKSLSITKKWKDNSNALNLRPTSINVDVYQGTTKYKTEKLSKTNNLTDINTWAKTIELPKYNKNGIELNYTIQESIITLSNGDQYTPSISGTSITNTLTGTVNLNGTKVWKDNNNSYSTRPANYTVKLYRNGTQADSKSFTNSSGWSFTGLAKYDSTGKLYTYTIQEDTITLSNGDIYVPSLSGTTLTNTLTGTTSLNGTKVWIDNSNAYQTRPASYTVKLYQNGTYQKATTFTNNQGWSFTGLAKYDTSGKLYTYTISEDTITLSNGDKYVPSLKGTVLTNTLTGNLDLTITKIWKDESNKYDTRPSALDITLFQNNASHKVLTLNKTNADKWTYNVTVDKYDSNGKKYTYTIKEDENNKNLLYYYQEPIYNQENLTVTNTSVWLPINDNDIPQHRITVVKNILNSNNQTVTADDFNKIKLNINDTYKFPIILKELNRTLSKGETSMLENYAGYSGNIYNGIVTNKGNLVFNKIPAGKYEISEGFVQYFNFVNFTELSSTEGAKLTKENGKYYITISGITTNDEYIETKVTNKLEDFRLYEDKKDKINLFKFY